MTNESQSTGTVANEALGSDARTWDEATYTWDAAVGTWDNPYSINNESLNTGTIANEAQS